VLMQNHHPIAFICRELKNSEKFASTYKRDVWHPTSYQEMEAIHLAREFIIKTDHKPLEYLLEHRLDTEAQYTWLLKLHNYKFMVEYKKGRENMAADILSRREEIEDQVCMMISVVESDWIEQVRVLVQEDIYFQ